MLCLLIKATFFCTKKKLLKTVVCLMSSSCAWVWHQSVLLKATLIQRISTECAAQNTFGHSSFSSSSICTPQASICSPMKEPSVGIWVRLCWTPKALDLAAENNSSSLWSLLLRNMPIWECTGTMLVWMMQYRIELLESRSQVFNKRLLCYYCILNPCIFLLLDLTTPQMRQAFNLRKQ